MVRASLPKGNTGVQTAYDVFLLAPLGIGVADQSAGGSLVVIYLTAREIKNCLEFLLVGNPNLPGQYFPRVSGMRFSYDPSRPQLDTVTEIELGDLDNGYRAMDFSEGATELYGVACNLYFGLVLASIPQKTNGALSLVPKTKNGAPMKSRVEALPDRPQGAPYLLPPRGTIDADQAVHGGAGARMETKEWQAIMDFMKSLPTKNDKGVSVLALDERFKENRSVNVGTGTGSRALQ
jgi:5'-nucleotidase